MLRSALSFALSDMRWGRPRPEEEPEQGLGREEGGTSTCSHLRWGWVNGCGVRMQIRLSEQPIRSQVRKFGSPPHPNRACEHVCGVLGPLSRKVTLGGQPGPLFLPHTLPRESSLPLTPQVSSRAAAGENLQHYDLKACATRPRQVAGTAGPTPGESARVHAVSLGQDTRALQPAGQSSLRLQTALPASNLRALGLLWVGPVGLRKLLQRPEHRK